jgi:Carboxypeptidase regulatory-like domain
VRRPALVLFSLAFVVALSSAHIAVTAKTTGTLRESATNADGLFVLTNLPAGECYLEVRAPGFADTVHNSVILHVGETTQLDLTLKIASVTDKIVDDDTIMPLINPASSVVDGIISSQSIETLPLNGRNFLELALLILGNSPAPNFDPTKSNTVVNLESSVNTKYDGLLLSLQKRFSRHTQFMASYTLSKSFNYSNDQQIPFAGGPLNANDLRLECGPAPNDQRHRFIFSGLFELPYGSHLSPIWPLASGVPMDILLPDASARIPVIQRIAGAREFHTAAQLNAFITQINATGGVNGSKLPLVLNSARFNDSFNSLNLRISRWFHLSEHITLEPIVEVFNLFNVTNILGTSNVNYSGFNNVLAPDRNDPTKSSSFGTAVTTAGGIFGSGGPRAFQFAVPLNF